MPQYNSAQDKSSTQTQTGCWTCNNEPNHQAEHPYYSTESVQQWSTDHVNDRLANKIAEAISTSRDYSARAAEIVSQFDQNFNQTRA